MQKNKRRQVGLLVPVSMLPGGQGIGDPQAVIGALDFCARYHIAAMQVLPIGDSGFDPSPFSGVDSGALSHVLLHMAPGWVPGLTADNNFLDQPQLVSSLNDGGVNYPVVNILKARALQDAFKHLEVNSAADQAMMRRRRKFADDNQDWLPVYTLFRVLMGRYADADFKEWPGASTYEEAERWLSGLSNPERRLIETKRRFHTYVQWVADEQWLRVKAHAERLGIQLIGDIPYSMSRKSTVMWGLDSHLFKPNWSGGAPPERAFGGTSFLSRFGQNWGGAVPRWDRHEEIKFAWWERRIQRIARYFHRFKFDHALGPFRQWCFPFDPGPDQQLLSLTPDQVRQFTGGRYPQFLPRGDDSPDDRERNRQDGRRRIAAIMDLSSDHGVDVFFEALGVVPPYVRPTLDELGAARIIIPHWEPLKDGFYPSMADYPQKSVAAWGTHDQKPQRITYEEMWARSDDQGQWEMERMTRLLDLDHPPTSYTPGLHMRTHEALMESTADTVMFYAPSFFATRLELNRPGTTAGCWTERFPQPFEAYEDDPIVGPLLRALPRMIERTGRRVN